MTADKPLLEARHTLERTNTRMRRTT